jgi:hypothetical protein
MTECQPPTPNPTGEEEEEEAGEDDEDDEDEIAEDTATPWTHSPFVTDNILPLHQWKKQSLH